MGKSKLILKRLDTDTKLKPFCCSDTDLNGFLFDDATNYSKELLAVTYLLETEDNTIAYFSVFNDRVHLKEEENSTRNKVNRSIPNPKRINSYPAVKIGRLAVSEEFANQGFGSKIISFIKSLFATNNKTGCRFITVDAYRAALPFYEKNGFKPLTQKDVDEDTRLLYYDLKKFLQE